MATQTLSPEQIRELSDKQDLLKEAEAMIRQAEAAGIDVTEQKKQAAALAEQMRKIKNVYGQGL